MNKEGAKNLGKWWSKFLKKHLKRKGKKKK
jgi:hypothetical protein